LAPAKPNVLPTGSEYFGTHASRFSISPPRVMCALLSVCSDPCGEAAGELPAVEPRPEVFDDDVGH
jgi:hypothetical protein